MKTKINCLGYLLCELPRADVSYLFAITQMLWETHNLYKKNVLYRKG